MKIMEEKNVTFIDAKIDAKSPFTRNNLDYYNKVRKMLKEQHFDLVHCHTPIGSVIGRVAAHKTHTKIIYTAHGFHFYKGAPIINWLLFYPVEKYLAKYTDTLITINKEDYKLAKKRFNKRCKNIEYVPGVGIDVKKFNTSLPEKEVLCLCSTELDLRLRNYQIW